MTALRKALGDGQSGARYVANVSGPGYCFVAPIRAPETRLRIADNSPTSGAAKLPASLTRMVGRDDIVRAISEEIGRSAVS